MVFDKSKRIYKGLGVLALFSLIFQVVSPTLSFAQAGPNQIESTGLTHTSAGEHVDNFTGDFNYSIPIIEIDGFPLILSYDANVSMHQEASWVGLGWSLNPGSISRQMRGVPDEFNGQDKINREYKQKDPMTAGKKFGGSISNSFNLSSYGIPMTGGHYDALFLGKYYNNYKGLGKTFDYIHSGNFSYTFGVNIIENMNLGLTLTTDHTLAFSFDSQKGIGFNPSKSIGAIGSVGPFNAGVNGTMTHNINSRSGLTARTLDVTMSAGKSNSLGSKSISGTLSSVKTFGTQTYLPRYNFDALAFGESERLGLGFFTKNPIHTNTIMAYKETYYSILQNIGNIREMPAYGYNNLELGKDDPQGVMDFNREKEREFSKHMKSLPFTNITYDLYQINTPGVSDQFRSYRNDVGTLTDPTVRLNGVNKNVLSSEALGFLYQQVKGAGGTITRAESGEWVNQDGTSNPLSFTDNLSEGYEKFHFKVVGEKTPFNEELYNSFGNETPLVFPMYEDPSLTALNTLGFLQKAGGTALSLPAVAAKSDREIRAKNIQYYTYNELTELGESEIRNYDLRTALNGGSLNYTVISDQYRKDHHYGKLEVSDATGTVYSYGIAAYNISEHDVAFNVEPNVGDVSTSSRLVNYDLGTFPDNSLNNHKGRDEFFEKISTPAYAYAHLLTEIKSSDYTDRTGDGVSVDDGGKYYKFNYTRVSGGSAPFVWRFPVSEKDPSTSGYPQANYSPGHETDLLDDKGFYKYGEKEVWYPNSIETQNYILEFYLSDRSDAFPVVDENGKLDLSNPGKLLDKIVLYSREDREQNGNDATPLQTVHFVYDYSLCKNYPSNKYNGVNYSKSGKLTLKSVHITSGDSDLTYSSPYEFTYESGANNPDFNYLNVDRWSNYKVSGSILNNHIHPYSEQDEVIADENIKSWKMNKIVYPTGGGMEVEYEADTYGHVQNQDAMKHVQIQGMTDLAALINQNYNAPSDNYNPSGSNNITAYSQFRNSSENKKPFNVVYFKLDEPIVASSKSEADFEVDSKYFTGMVNGQYKRIEEVFYRTKLKIKEDDNILEYVPGFARIESTITKSSREYKDHKSEIDLTTNGSFLQLSPVGAVGGASGTYYYGYVILEAPPVDEKTLFETYTAHPMQANAWNYCRVNLPDQIYAKCEDNLGNPSIDDCDYGIGIDLKTLFTGKVNKTLNNNNFCSFFDNKESFIRLLDSDDTKIGGNARVASITHFDSWDDISGEPEATYTLEYDYNDENGVTSGVAAYEPIHGADENVFYQPKYFNIYNILASDEKHYQIDPVGESVFPSPIVGYSEVSVRFKEIANVTKNATGISRYYYHTYKDYPVVVEKSGILKKGDDDMTLEGIWNIALMGVSQGFTVSLNDMHGKIKEVEVDDQYGNEVSSTKYKYDLYNKQKVINEKGEIEYHWLGKEFDAYADKRFVSQMNLSGMATTTKEVSVLGIQNKSLNAYIQLIMQKLYIATFQKVINHTAVLKEVESTYLGQTSRKKVLAFDKFSGVPIVQSSENEYLKDDYSVNYPAYWKYSEISSKFKNERAFFSNVSVDGNSNLNGVSAVENWFTRGDVIILTDGAQNSEIARVLEIDEVNDQLLLIDLNGQPIQTNNNLTLTILRSGFKNRLHESMASFYLKDDPLANQINLVINPSGVIASSAIEFSENKATVCEEDEDCVGNPNPNSACADDLSNPFANGTIANWRANKVYSFQGERINGDAAGQTDIRVDGRIENFIPFYAFGNSKWNSIVEPGHPNYISTSDFQKWRTLKEVTQFDRFGKSIESRSQLGIYTSVLYGYNNNFKSVPIAYATNARVNQIAFDGFEDYTYLNGSIICNTTGHLDFKDVVQTSDLVSDERHTGNYSLKVNEQSSFSTTRSFRPCNQQTGENCDCEAKFAPTAGKYIIGAWVKQSNSTNLTSYPDASLVVEFTDGGGSTFTNYDFQPTGKIVDGWQRIEGVFEIPEVFEDALCITVSLENGGGETMYFDDLRIHPFVSSMTTMVYDANLLIPMAKLDDYNYATFYMYDENLQQVRVRQETERGIETIYESNSGVKK